LKEKKEAEKKEINDSLNYKKRLEDQKRFEMMPEISSRIRSVLSSLERFERKEFLIGRQKRSERQRWKKKRQRRFGLSLFLNII
jgi:hypothetical protein